METGNKRTAVVTGGAGGIGLASATALAAQGFGVVLLDRSADEALKAADTLRGSGAAVRVVVADLASLAEVVRAADDILAAGGCDVLVNNAGIHPKKNGGKFETPEIPLDDWERVLRVNLTAPFLLCQRLMPGMRAKGWGRVVNIASRAGRTYIPTVTAHYSTSKAGLIGFTRQLAGEFAADGVTVNCVAPGPVTTALSSQNSPEVRERLMKSVPIGRASVPAEIASAVAFLASDAASYMTGAVLDVNGGGFMG